MESFPEPGANPKPEDAAGSPGRGGRGPTLSQPGTRRFVAGFMGLTLLVALGLIVYLVSRPPKAPPAPRRLELTEGKPARDAATEALSLLRAGMEACVRDKSGLLPATSAPVPIALERVGASGYASEPRDWGKPAWLCAGFSVSGPQRFQIQWQNDPGEGARAVAWVDGDGDGRVDEALSFEARLEGRGKVELGPVGPAVPVPTVAPPR